MAAQHRGKARLCAVCEGVAGRFGRRFSPPLLTPCPCVLLLQVSSGEPHAIRRREILAKYGDKVRKLYGYDHATAYQVRSSSGGWRAAVGCACCTHLGQARQRSLGLHKGRSAGTAASSGSVARLWLPWRGGAATRPLHAVPASLIIRSRAPCMRR